jgi:hypothetical protein
MAKLITPEEIAKDTAKKMMTPEQRIQMLEDRFEMMRNIISTSFAYIQSLLSNQNYKYDEAFIKITKSLETSGGFKQDANGGFTFPEDIEKTVPTNVKLMFLLTNNYNTLKII